MTIILWEITDSAGIYRVVFAPNGEFYLGGAGNIRHRLTSHFGDLRRGKHHSPLMQAAFNRYGENAMSVEVIATCAKDEKRLFEMRALRWEALARPSLMLNVTGNPLHPRSQEWREKHSRIQKGKPKHTRSPELYEKMMRTRPRGETHPNWGKKRDPETVRRMSESLKGRSTWNKGRAWSQEVKDKISASKRARRDAKLKQKSIA